MAEHPSPHWDVVVVGGGNAALCAALSAAESGARVLMLESAPEPWRGGNSVHTRNIRCMHEAPEDVLTGAYTEEEFWQDLLQVTAGKTNETLARQVVRASAQCRTWMRRHGVHFQPSLSGTLHLSRTNAFFMGGGKALVNAYYRSAARLGVTVLYEQVVDRLEWNEDRVVAVHAGSQRHPCATVVLACGGFESNIDWQREAWGQNAWGEWTADNFRIRGTRYNMGTMLAHLMQAGADTVGDPTQAHCVAVDARAPLYDGGIATRVDCVSLGIMVNQDAQRFDDEGKDFWPKRYAVWGRLVAAQRGQIGYAIIDAKARGRFMPAVFAPEQADSLEELALRLNLSAQALTRTVSDYNAACRVGTFDHAVLDDCHTEGLTPPKTHWARPLDTPPYFGYRLCPGITFTYLGLQVDAQAAVSMQGRPAPNLFAAGEIMAGNVLGQGYTAGVGMTIGTVFGCIAGTQAARAARSSA